MGKEIFNIINDMSEVLSAAQLRKLQDVLVWRLSEEEKQRYDYSNKEYLDMFLAAKKLEGCSERTIMYYRMALNKMFEKVDVPVVKMTTEGLRGYLAQYQDEGHCSKITIDNIRRVLSTFFSWLEEEDYVVKSPVKRIHKVKATEKVKAVISDENIEILRDGCLEKRDLAMVDLLL